MIKSKALTEHPYGWDRKYERQAVTLLALGFGLVGLDRWIIGPLFPAMMQDLHLDYADLGSAAGALALAWGLFSITMGNVSDRIGRRRVLIPALILFSIMSGFTGLVVSSIALVSIRALMGAAEGAYLPTSVSAVAEASRPARRGLNQGLQLGMFPLLGFGFAPIIATQLLAVVPSWRYVLMLVAIPGLIVAFLLFKVLREPPHLDRRQNVVKREPVAWSLLLSQPNVLLASAGLVCAMSCVFVLGAMVPSYLTDYHKLSPQMMGLVMSAMGWGGFVGEFGVAGISDYIGRRWAAVLAFAGAVVSTWFFFHTGSSVLMLFVWLALLSLFGLGLTSVLTGPIASEAAPVGLTSSAIGMVSGVGEIFGGGVAPVIAGFVAQSYGIENIYWIPMIGLSAGLVLMLFLRETAPRLVSSGKIQATN